MANRWGNNGNNDGLYFLGVSKITADDDCIHDIKRLMLIWRKVMTNLDSVLKSRDITLPTKVHLVKDIYGFSSSHVWMWELDYKESWALKNWWFLTVVLEKTLESPLDCREIQPVHPKGNQSWIFIERTDAGAEPPILWPPAAKKWLIVKVPYAGKDWRQEEKGMTEDEMVEWYHRLNGHEFEQTQGDGEGQGDLTCCSPWGHKELNMTEQLNSRNKWHTLFIFCLTVCQSLFTSWILQQSHEVVLLSLFSGKVIKAWGSL